MTEGRCQGKQQKPREVNFVGRLRLNGFYLTPLSAPEQQIFNPRLWGAVLQNNVLESTPACVGLSWRTIFPSPPRLRARSLSLPHLAHVSGVMTCCRIQHVCLGLWGEELFYISCQSNFPVSFVGVKAISLQITVTTV